MQLLAAIRSLRLLQPAPSRACLVPFAPASSTKHRTADPAVHSEPPQGEEAVKAEENEGQPPRDTAKTNEPTDPVKTPPFASSPRLESTPVGPGTDPAFQQKRRWSTRVPLDDVACFGADGSPLDGKSSQGFEQEAEEKADDYREYYSEHKASPLSELEFADTRKPITQAVDGEKRDDMWGRQDRGVYLPDTVDDSLRRAEEMFNAARESGDPTMPHSRALMRMMEMRAKREQ